MGVLERIWASLIEECAELGGVEWEWQAADSAMGKARLCLDKGYDNPTGHQAVAAHGYRGHVRRIGEEKLDPQGVKRYPARRWVVERTLAWLSKCRAILVRYDKKASNYMGLVQLACALLWYRRQRQLRF